MAFPWLPNILLFAALGTLLASVALHRQETETVYDLDSGNISIRYTYLGLFNFSVSQASNVVGIWGLIMHFSPFSINVNRIPHLESLFVCSFMRNDSMLLRSLSFVLY